MPTTARFNVRETRDAALRVLRTANTLDHLARVYHPESGLVFRAGDLTWDYVAESAGEAVGLLAEAHRGNLEALVAHLSDKSVAARLENAHGGALAVGGHSARSYASAAALIGRDRYDKLLYAAAPDLWSDWMRRDEGSYPALPHDGLRKRIHSALRALHKCQPFDYRSARDGVMREGDRRRGFEPLERLPELDSQIVHAIRQLQLEGTRYPTADDVAGAIDQSPLDVVDTRMRAMFEHYLLDQGPDGVGYTIRRRRP